MKPAIHIVLLAVFIASCARQDAPPAAVTTAYITGTGVNLRDSPGTSGKVLGMLNRPEKVTVLEKVETGNTDNPLWFKVTTAAGATGYVSSRYLATNDSPPAVTSGNVDGGQWKVTVLNGTLSISERSTGRVLTEETCPGTGGSAVTSRHGNYLFVAVMTRESVAALLTLVVDTTSGKFLKLGNGDNPNVLSVSPSNRYMLVDWGTSGSHRRLTVIELLREQPGEVDYISYFNLEKPSWISGNAFEYYMIVGRKAPGKPELHQSAEGTPNSYAQKIIWDDGKLVRTNEYTAVYSGSGG
ncbi:MAG: SH3 domain-containing protein [Spirochaetes bacterium]|nr:SH3 domain-containing protein [Spirochaetota bacterium]